MPFPEKRKAASVEIRVPELRVGDDQRAVGPGPAGELKCLVRLEPMAGEQAACGLSNDVFLFQGAPEAGVSVEPALLPVQAPVCQGAPECRQLQAIDNNCYF